MTTLNSSQIDPRTPLNCPFAHDKKKIHPLLQAKCDISSKKESDLEPRVESYNQLSKKICADVFLFLTPSKTRKIKNKSPASYWRPYFLSWDAVWVLMSKAPPARDVSVWVICVLWHLSVTVVPEGHVTSQLGQTIVTSSWPWSLMASRLGCCWQNQDSSWWSDVVLYSFETVATWF